MKIGIVGSRNFPRMVLVRDWIVEHVSSGDSVVTGGTRGVDEQALRVCIDTGIRVLVIPPPNEILLPGQSFGQRCAARNHWIVEESHRIVAFWDGSSNGTAMTIAFAGRRGKPVEVIRP